LSQVASDLNSNKFLTAQPYTYYEEKCGDESHPEKFGYQLTGGYAH